MTIEFMTLRSASENMQVPAVLNTYTVTHLHHQLQLGVELTLVEGGHLNLSSIIFPVTHGAHYFCSIVSGLALQVNVTWLQPWSGRCMLWTDDQDAKQLSMSTAAFPHILNNIGVVVLRCLVIHLQYLVDSDYWTCSVNL